MKAPLSQQQVAPVDIGRVLDDGPWIGLQKLAAILAAIAIIADGFDGQLIGYAIPSLMAEWGVTRAEFAPVVAIGLLGMGIGTASAGLFADRFGRKSALIVGIIVFGLATCCIGFAQNFWQVGLIPTVIKCDSCGGSQQPANVNLWCKQEVCDGFSAIFTNGLRRFQVAASGSPDTQCRSGAAASFARIDL